MFLVIASLILRALGAAPLVAYPAVLVANLMQASALMQASKHPDGPNAGGGLMTIFVGGTTVYPLVLLGCYWMAARENPKRELAWSAAPLLYLGALAALFSVVTRGEGGE